MATLSITKTYSDGVILTESDLDSIKSDIETFLNTTKLNDDNIQNAGITGSTKLIDASISTAKLATSAVTTAKINDDAVTNAKIATDAVNADSIAAGAVDTAELATDAVTNAKIATDAVNADSIEAGAVDTAELATDAVTTVKITDANVTTAKIANADITLEKLGAGNRTMIAVSTDTTTAEKVFATVTTAETLNSSNHARVGLTRGVTVGATASNWDLIRSGSANYTMRIRRDNISGTVVWIDANRTTDITNETATWEFLDPAPVDTYVLTIQAASSETFTPDNAYMFAEWS